MTMTMHTASSLLQLADEVGAAARLISAHLARTQHAEPSMAAAGGVSLPRDPEILQARKQLVAAADKLTALASYDAMDVVKSVTWGMFETAALGTVNRFDIAKILPEDGKAMHIRDIAEQGGADEERLLSCLRFLTQRHIFLEVQPEYFAHSHYSLVLRDPLVKSFIVTAMDENWKSAAAVPASTQRSTDINPTNKRSPAAFNIAFDTEKPLFQWLSSDQTRFDRFMRAVSAGGYGGCEVVAQVYPWRNLGPATVVDVGGGTGVLAKAIAHTAPQLQITVQDLAPNVLTGRSQLPVSLATQITFEEGNFMQPQTREADVYVLRMVLHNYNDETYVHIVKNLLPMLRPGGRILLGETAYRPGLEMAGVQRAAAGLDFTMMTMFGARVRSFDEHLRLLRLADERFTLKQYGESGPAGSEILEATLVECSWEGCI